MERVLVSGISGSGKTTLARIARHPHVKVVHLTSPRAVTRWLETLPRTPHREDEDR